MIREGLDSPLLTGSSEHPVVRPSWTRRTCQSIFLLTCLFATILTLEGTGFRQWINERLLGIRHAPEKPVEVLPKEENAGGPIWFQAHSVNDLRQWESLYMKGTRSFKIDPHFVRGDGSIFNRTRMVFTHNSPFFSKHIKYDGFDDLLHELGPLGKVGSRLKADGTSLRIQLCFKSPPALSCNSTHHFRTREQRAWLSIIDDFYGKVEDSSFINEHVNFLLDGGGKPSGCLKNKWKKWKSTWILGDPLSPSSALTSEVDWQDADNSRFVLMNNPASIPNWQRMANLNFGRFNMLPYPYQIWEPDDQSVIRQHADIFLQTKPEHPPGLHFVSNSDPLMVALYAGATGTFNRPVLIDASISCPIGIVPGKGTLITVYRQNGRLRSSFFMNQLGLEAVHVSTTDVDDPKDGNLWTRFEPENENMAILSNAKGLFKRVWIHPWNGNFYKLGEEVRAPQPDAFIIGGAEKQIRCLVVKRIPSTGDLVALWTMQSTVPRDVKEEDCVLAAVHFKIDSKKANQTEFITSTCLARAGLKSIPMDADLVPLARNEFGVVFSDQQKQVLGILWDPSVNGTRASPKPLGVGATPRFTHVEPEGIAALYLADSFCSNNNDYNRRAGPTSICDNPPQSSRGVMTYTIGLKNHWLEAIHKGRRLSACDVDLLHGAFDIGTCPFGGIVMESRKEGTAQLVSVHRTVDDLRSNEKACATPMWTNSLVLNKVPLFFDGTNSFLRKKEGIRLLARRLKTDNT